MSVRKSEAAPRLERHPILNEPPLGHFQLLILLALHDLGGRSYAYAVRDLLQQRTGRPIGHAQIYVNMRRFRDHSEPLALIAETRHSDSGGPPQKLYTITSAGYQAMNLTVAHYRAMIDYVDTTVARD